MKYSELEKKLKKAGCSKLREGKKHPIWISPITNKKFAMSYHKSQEVKTGTLNSIMKDAGLKWKQFFLGKRQWKEMGLEEKLVDTSLKIKVFIETGSDLTYNAYTNEDLPFGVFGEGETIQETKDDFIETFEELLNEYNQESNTNLKYSFEFKYDISSFLKEYGNIFSMSALERLSGINQKQLHHYASGLKNPRTAQRKKIENSLRELGKKLVLVELD